MGKAEQASPQEARTIANVFSDLQALVNLTDAISGDNYDTDVNLGLQAERLNDVSVRATSLSEELNALNAAIN